MGKQGKRLDNELVKPDAASDEFEDVTALIYPDKLPLLERTDIEPMTPDERKRRLARFAREDIITPNGQPHRMPAIQSIIELNKMDGSYAPQRHQHQHVVFRVHIVGGVGDSEDIGDTT